MTHHDVSFIAKNPLFLLLGDEKHAVKQEGVSEGFRSVHSESSLCTEFSKCGQVLALPTIQKTLNLLHTNCMLVSSLHVIDVMSNACHGWQSVHNILVTLTFVHIVFNYVLQTHSSLSEILVPTVMKMSVLRVVTSSGYMDRYKCLKEICLCIQGSVISIYKPK